jgi:outer membrane protein assembly factor BamB
MKGRQSGKPSSIQLAAFELLAFAVTCTLLAASQTSVNTYHYDNRRTGWNSNESILTPANINSRSFGLLETVTLDEQVDAQPLFVSGVLITTGQYHDTTHDVVYVVTEGNSVYAIDANSGTILLSKNLGSPVPYPPSCNAMRPSVGITSTPVIDPVGQILYVMAYTGGGAAPSYHLHALELGTLRNHGSPRLVKASHTLTNGTTFNFDPAYQQQRPALVLANGNIYAGFGSFCDTESRVSRGWLLGWTADTLTPLLSNQLVDVQATDARDFFLSSIWMSGYAPAVDDLGNILFVTGNSDPSGNTYDGVTNIQESVVKVYPALTAVKDLFTPSNQPSLDKNDEDFGSGGVLLLPDQPGSIPHLAAAAGKNGQMYLMNEDNLGGFSPDANNVLGTYRIGGCWCGQSYFVDPIDGLGRIVASGGRIVTVWRVLTSPTVALQLVTTSPSIGGAQHPGFFTVISSKGNSHPIIWALSRPLKTAEAPIYLFAFNPESSGAKMTQLFKAEAGVWPNAGNLNQVPVVANGKVFVASNKQLQIFGLTSSKATKK